MRPQQTVPDIYAYGRQLAEDGLTNGQIVHLLCGQGLNETAARELVDNLREMQAQAQRRQRERYRRYATALLVNLILWVVAYQIGGAGLLGFAIIGGAFLMYAIRRPAYEDQWLDRRAAGRLRL